MQPWANILCYVSVSYGHQTVQGSAAKIWDRGLAQSLKRWVCNRETLGSNPGHTGPLFLLHHAPRQTPYCHVSDKILYISIDLAYCFTRPRIRRISKSQITLPRLTLGQIGVAYSLSSYRRHKRFKGSRTNYNSYFLVYSWTILIPLARFLVFCSIFLNLFYISHQVVFIEFVLFWPEYCIFALWVSEAMRINIQTFPSTTDW